MMTARKTSFLVNCLLVGWSAVALADQAKPAPAAPAPAPVAAAPVQAPAPAPTTAKAPAAASAPATAPAAAKAPASAPSAVAAPAPTPLATPAAAAPVPVRAAAAPAVVAPAPARIAAPGTPTPAPAAPAAAPAPIAPMAKVAPAPAAPMAPAVATTKPSVAQNKPLPVAASATAVAVPVMVAPVVAAAPLPAPAPAIPKPAPELDQMKILEGHWRCEGRAPASASGPEHAYKSSWKFKRDLDNFWWAAEYQQKQAKAHPSPLKARGYLTWDPNTKAFVLVGVDNMGGTSTETTPGWSGDVVTLAGDSNVGGKKVPYREVITKKGTREFTWRGEMRMGGDWVTLGEDRCKKLAAE